MLFEDKEILHLNPHPISTLTEADSIHAYLWKHEMPKSELIAFGKKHFPDIHYEDLGNLCGKRFVEKFSVRLMLGKLFGSDSRLAYEKNGKPYIVDSHVHISISHSDPIYAVSLSSFRHGLDVEHWGNRAFKLQPYFLNPEEQIEESIPHSADINPEKWATILWSAKEAAYKYYNQPNIYLKENLLIGKRSDDFLEITCNTLDEKAFVFYDATPDCALTCCAARQFVIK